MIGIAAWSGPRNISTALMRSWENRPDCAVVDEPLYAAYLHRTGLEHPGRTDVLASQPTDLARAVAELSAPLPDGVAARYVKHMTHHLDTSQDWLGEDLAWTDGWHNVLVVRDPSEVVASYVRSRESCEPDDIGLLQQARLAQRWGDAAPVIDAGDFLRDPGGYLRWLCDWAGLPFTEAMLSWPAGPRDSDGVWAPHWYAAVEASTGFAPYAARGTDHLSDHDAAVAATCRPAYEELHARRLRL